LDADSENTFTKKEESLLLGSCLLRSFELKIDNEEDAEENNATSHANVHLCFDNNDLMKRCLAHSQNKSVHPSIHIVKVRGNAAVLLLPPAIIHENYIFLF